MTGPLVYPRQSPAEQAADDTDTGSKCTGYRAAGSSSTRQQEGGRPAAGAGLQVAHGGGGMQEAAPQEVHRRERERQRC